MQTKMLPVGTPNAHLILGTCIRVGEWLVPISEYKSIQREDARMATK